MPSDLGRRVIREQTEWREFIANEFGYDAILHYISPLDGDRRLYRFAGKIAKVRRIHENSNEQDQRQFGQDLARENHVLVHLEARGWPRFDAVYKRTTSWESLTRRFFEGIPFAGAWKRAGFKRRLALLASAAAAVHALNRTGVFHGDVVANNLIVEDSGRVRLVDFGAAQIVGARPAILQEWKRLLFGRHGLFARNIRKLTLRVFPFARAGYRRLKARRTAPFQLPGPKTHDMELLEDAWRQSTRWHTADGLWLAYSSLTVAGQQLPGQRPWLLRWDHLTKRVSFKGRRVLDLGCNAGLLGSFAMLHGASAYLGIDTEANLIGAARKTAAAFGVAAEFEVSDLDSLDPGDARFRDWDIVVAFSIFEWVKDKERLLALMGSGSEILYEGHDPWDVEARRLQDAGFESIEPILVSERGRTLIHGLKSAGSDELTLPPTIELSAA